MTALTGFTILHANRAEMLRDVILAWLARDPLSSPLDDEVFLVQSQGMAQWLKHALAESPAGIAAALDFQLPQGFLWRCYRAVLGEDNVPAQSPFDKAPLSWRLYRELPAWLHEPVFAPLARFVEADADPRRLYQLAHQLADLYDQYQSYRADWLAGWENDHDDITRHGRPAPLPEGERWQAELWRRLAGQLASARHTHRAAVHQRFVAALREGTPPPGSLPERVVVFGLSALPQQTLEALDAISRHSHVLMAVNNPCRYYWGDIVEGREWLRRQAEQRHRRRSGMPAALDDSTLHLHAHPLLASWGRQGRDFIALLADYDRWQSAAATHAQDIDLFDEAVPAGTLPLLQQVQQAVLELEPLPAEPHTLPLPDHSIAFHVAHSPLREVEILHDQLLAMFDDPELALKPRDVMVMVPDISSYAPFIRAVFGKLPPDHPRFIPFALSDQSAVRTEPLLRALQQLLDLPALRLTVSEVLELLDVAVVRRRFRLRETDLPLLTRWIEGSGIRWGLSAAQRAELGMPDDFDQNSWHFGLDRMLLGYACGAGASWQGMAPYDEVGGMDAALAGQLADLLSTLAHWRQCLQEPATPAGWQARIAALVEACLDIKDEHDLLLYAGIADTLDNWVATLDGNGLADTRLPLEVVRDVLLGQLADTSVSMRFLGGAVNFGTLMPMRAIPFKVICLLGLNDGDYPRSQNRADFDLMAQDYRPGDRSRRDDDRYLLLEALLSARRRLYLSWVGKSPRDNRPRPPSVLVEQLRDYLAAGWQAAPAGTGPATTGLLAALTTEHPLQPFSPRYFSRAPDARPQPDQPPLFTYDSDWRAIHDATDPPAEPTAALPLPLPDWDGRTDAVTLARFLRQPAATFLHGRLKVRFGELDELAEDEPFALDPLATHQLKSRLLEAVRDVPEAETGRHWHAAATRLTEEGGLPFGAAGAQLLQACHAPVMALRQNWHRLDDLTDLPPLTLPPLLLPLAGDQTATLLAHCDGLQAMAPDSPPLRRRVMRTGRLADSAGRGADTRWIPRLHTLVGFWPAHLALQAAGFAIPTLIVGETVTLRLAPLPADEARHCLQVLAGYWRQAHGEPLPLPCKTTGVWLQQQDASAARQAYEGGYHSTGERAESPALARLFPAFEDLDLARLDALATDLYAPLLASVTVPESAA